MSNYLISHTNSNTNSNACNNANAYNNSNIEQNKRGELVSPHEKSFDFKCYKDNTIQSLRDVNCFLNNLHHAFKCIKIFKLFK